jgi:hypothetical protein
MHMHSIGRAHRAGGSDQSLKRSHGRVLWAIDALMCSGVGPSRFVARWFKSIAPKIACAVVSRHHEMERETGLPRTPGELSGRSRMRKVLGPRQEALQEPGVLPRAGRQKAPKKAWRGGCSLEEMHHAQSATRDAAKINKGLNPGVKRAL